MREIPVRDVVPLIYICRPTNLQDKYVYNDFIDEYINKVPLVRQAFTADAAEVHTYIFRFTPGNMVAEAKMVAHAAENNCHIEFMALKYYYEGIGVHAVYLVRADKVLKFFFNSGEKKPHMWWDEFERQLTNAFNTYDCL